MDLIEQFAYSIERINDLFERSLILLQATSMILGKNNTLNMNTKSPHFWWIISIMVTAIIVLVSFILCEKTIDADKIMEFISYSSAILSIALSIFAIQYPYTSNV